MYMHTCACGISFRRRRLSCYAPIRTIKNSIKLKENYDSLIIITNTLKNINHSILMLLAEHTTSVERRPPPAYCFGSFKATSATTMAPAIM